MSSLHSRMLKRGYSIVRPPSDWDKDEYYTKVKVLEQAAKRPDCILVNIQSVISDLFKKDHDVDFEKMTALTPPFPKMWMEFIWPGDIKVAIQVNRETTPEGHECWLHQWEECRGELVGPCYETVLILDRLGSILRSNIQEIGELDNESEARESSRKATAWILCGVLHALARMNCRNVELRVISEAKYRPHARRKIIPASVWHEIKVTSVPHIRTTGHGVTGNEPIEIRSQLIRGHYADYRKGAGLFGNPKLRAIFWIPEHRRGDERLGQVIPEYVLQS